jgi:hypothetical protein
MEAIYQALAAQYERVLFMRPDNAIMLIIGTTEFKINVARDGFSVSQSVDSDWYKMPFKTAEDVIKYFN